MLRRVIEIEEEKCNGCGACANACHEGAISIVNGKAKLMRDDYCDGLGDCLSDRRRGECGRTYVGTDTVAGADQAGSGARAVF